MKGTIAFFVGLFVVGAVILMWGAGVAANSSNMAVVQTAGGTYLLDKQEAAARIATDVAWQQQQAEVAAAADRENTSRWTLFSLAAAGLIVVAGVGIGVGFALPVIRRQQAQAARYEAEARAYSRYLAGRGPLPAHLLNETQTEILRLVPALPPAPYPAPARVERRV